MPFTAIQQTNHTWQYLSVDSLRNINTKESAFLYPAYALKPLEFCRRWLSGERVFVFQTSGTTGKPKNISLQRSQMEASAKLTQQALALNEGMNCFVCLDTSYIAGCMMLVRALTIGMNIYLVAPTSEPLNYLLNTHIRIDFASFVPLQLHHALQPTHPQTQAYKAVLNAMQAILVGGAGVSEAFVQATQTLSVPIYHSYAMTETASHIALKLLNTPKKQVYFEVLPNISISQDARQCLQIYGEVTNFQTITTNDRVNMITPHSFEFLGRIDRLINTGGIKIQTETIEAGIAQVWEVLAYKQRFVVTAIPDDMLGQKIVLIVEETPSNSLIDEADIRKYCQQYLNKYAIPKQILYCPQFIETPTQKIDIAATLAIAMQAVR